MHLFYQPLIPAGTFVLPADESRHAVKVLRVTEGDVIEIADGAGTFYQARITHPDSGNCGFVVIGSKSQLAKNYRIHIAIAPTKNIDRTEWFVEKAVELGIDEISFIECKTSERKSVNMERMEKLAISAMKQSQQASLPILNPMSKLKTFLSHRASQKFIAFVDNENPIHLKSGAKPGNHYLILIGPEGDFSSTELQDSLDAGYQKVSLGPSRLRTETAALAACLTLNLVNQ
jgi:16S rRNA (uracil1498-N3)-methyltransferase